MNLNKRVLNYSWPLRYACHYVLLLLNICKKMHVCFAMSEPFLKISADSKITQIQPEKFVLNYPLTIYSRFLHSFRQKQLSPPPYTVRSSFHAMIDLVCAIVYTQLTLVARRLEVCSARRGPWDRNKTPKRADCSWGAWRWCGTRGESQDLRPPWGVAGRASSTRHRTLRRGTGRTWILCRTWEESWGAPTAWLG